MRGVSRSGGRHAEAVVEMARRIAAGNMVSTAHQDAGDVDPAELARVEDDFAAQAEKILRESARYCECVGGERYGG